MSLFQCKNPKHAAYIHILAGKREEDRARKEILEQYWAIYEPYADTHFLEEIGINFYQRVWEMRLGVDLLAMGLKLEPTGDDGPDFVFEYKGKKIWIEAIVPEKGNT